MSERVCCKNWFCPRWLSILSIFFSLHHQRQHSAAAAGAWLSIVYNASLKLSEGGPSWRGWLWFGPLQPAIVGMYRPASSRVDCSDIRPCSCLFWCCGYVLCCAYRPICYLDQKHLTPVSRRLVQDLLNNFSDPQRRHAVCSFMILYDSVQRTAGLIDSLERTWPKRKLTEKESKIQSDEFSAN